ncbi:hypothetical protein DFQ26_004858 [Actinomortierella ambigua]|nr:hypothetical protein DFQ26_004858 [Actinomortierella ambigua]
MLTKLKASLLLLHLAVFVYGFQLQRLDSELSNINRIGWSIYFSRGAALCLAMDMVLIMIPACRKLLSLLARLTHALFGWGQGSVSEGSYSSMVLFHKYMAVYIAVFTGIHLGGHCVNFFRLQILGFGSMWSYHFGTWAGLTGYGMLILLGAMFATAHRRIRRPKFEVFWYTHHLFLVVMVLFSFHAYGCFVKTNDGVCRGYGSWRYVVVATSLYGLDRALRYLDSRRAIPLISATAHPGGALELCFRPPLHLQRYHPGQHLYLNIPTLSKYQWHPFTITSSPIESTMTLDIRQDGDWTCALGETLGYGRSSINDRRPHLDQSVVVDDPAVLPRIRVDGPYGGLRRDVLDFDHAVLIGTGTGITTFSGILRHIWFRHQITQNSRLKSLDLYWVTRDTKRLDWFKSLFSMDKTLELFRMGLIRIHIYFTAPSVLVTTTPSSSTTFDPVEGHNTHRMMDNKINSKRRAKAVFLEQLVRSTRTSFPRQAQEQDRETAAAWTIQMDDNRNPRRHSYSDDEDDDAEEHDELLSPRSLFQGDQLLPRGSTVSNISLSTLKSPPQVRSPALHQSIVPSSTFTTSTTPTTTTTAAKTSNTTVGCGVTTTAEREGEDEEDDTISGSNGILGQNNIHFGRPRFHRILRDLKSTIGRERQQQQHERQQQSLCHHPGNDDHDHEDEDDEHSDEDEAGDSRDPPSHAYRSSWSLWPPLRRGKGHHHQLQAGFAQSQIQVGVFYSGSPALAKMLERECQQHSDEQTRFVFVTE